MEAIQNIIELFSSPEFYAALVALGAALKAAGALFEQLGTLRKNKTWSDGIGGKTLWVADEIGKVASWFAPGNSKEDRQPGVVLRTIQLFKSFRK